MKFIVPKGFIAIDGTSLTICDVNHAEGWFTFMLIEYTQKKIIVPKKEVGMFVNLEVDVLMKGAESAMAAIKPRIDELERQVEELRAEISALKG
jgi:riboflavin synthase